MKKEKIFSVNADVFSKISDLKDFSFPDLITRFNFKSKNFMYYCLLRKPLNNNSKKLFVLLHGAKDRSISNQPYFDRWSWVDVFPGYMLNISDPTLQLSSRIGLAWYGGNFEEHPLEIIARIVKSIAKKIGIEEKDIIFWGSSGGGFASMYASLEIDGSKSVVFNPQTEVLRYHEKHVRMFLNSCFNINDLSCLPSSVLDRLVLKTSSIKKTKSKIVIFQNINDEFHYINHFLKLKNRVEGEKLNNFSFYTYYDDAGHGPESKELAMKVLKYMDSGVEDFAYNKLLHGGEGKINLNSQHILNLLKEVRDCNKEIEDLDSIYDFAVKKYPSGWSIRSVYSEIKLNFGDVDKALDGFLSVKRQLVERTPEKVVKYIREIKKSKTLVNSIEGKIKKIPDYLNSKELFPFGFIFSLRPFSPSIAYPLDWEEGKVGSLYYIKHPNCSFQVIEKDKSYVVIFGNIYVAHGTDDLTENCLNILGGNIDALDNMSGRFCMVVLDGDKKCVFNDPIGSRSLYVNFDNYAVSSHLALLAYFYNLSINRNIAFLYCTDEYNKRGTRYLPGMSTMFTEALSLPPNNCFLLEEGRFERFYPYSNKNKTTLNELLCVVDEYFEKFNDWLHAKRIHPVLGLTSGVDSRAVIAALKAHSTPYSLVTWEKVSSDEREIINEMRSYLSDVSHVYIPVTFENSKDDFLDLVSIIDINTGFTRGGGAIACQMFAKTNFNFSINGQGGGLYNKFFNRKSLDSSNVDYKDIERFYINGLGVKPSVCFIKECESAFKNYFELTDLSGNKESELDILDLIYWEHRMGTWASNVMNEMDVSAFEIVGLNSRKVFDVAIRLSDKEHIGKGIMKSVCERYDKNLSKIGFKS